MGIVYLNSRIIGQQAYIQPQLLMPLDYILQCSACKKILLLEPETLAGIMAVVRIKHPGNGLGQFLFGAGAYIISLSEIAHINIYRAAGAPNTQSVSRV